MTTELPLVELREACLEGPQGPLYRNVNLAVFEGQCVRVVGAAGQGKSLLLELLAGRHRLTSGARGYPAFEANFPDARLGIAPRFAIRLVGSAEQRKLSTSQVSFYQARWHTLWTEPLTVLEFLSPRRVIGIKPYEVMEVLPVRRDFDAERERTLDDLELHGLEERLVAQLSNGELRKLLLAAAHLSSPRLLLLDDPMGGLAESTRERLAAVLSRWKGEGQTIVYTSTHEGELPDLATRCFTVSDGRVTEHARLTVSYAVTATHQPITSGIPAIPPLIEAGETIIRGSNVQVRMSAKVLLEDVSWHVRKGEHWLITGPNGSGKTTLLALLLGDHPQSYACDIEVLGTRLGESTNLWERRRSVGYVAPELAWHYPREVTLRELVLSGFCGSIGNYGAASTSELETTQALLATFKLENLAERQLAILSEGTVRLGLLLRAIVHQPRLLLLDEPTQELAQSERNRFMAELDRLAESGHTTLVLVTHHLDERPHCITHHLQLERGRAKHTGPLDLSGPERAT